MPRFFVHLVLTAALVIGGLVPAAAAGEGDHSDNLTHVANLAYEQRYGQTLPYGTDIEFAELGSKGREVEVALAGTYRNGLQIIDISEPEAPAVLGVWDCAIAQGDVQVFERDGRTYVGYTADGISRETKTESACYQEAKALGFEFPTNYGTFIADITDPTAPKTVSFVAIPKGSHNHTIAPGGKYLYNSNSDLIPNRSDPVPAIEVFDISNFAEPKLVRKLVLGTGIESHDITFNEAGTRAYSAALTHTLVIDTTNLADPKVIGRIVDPAINIHHQSDPVTITDPLLGKRTFLLVEDELAGAAGNGYCPGGGMHVYDITGELEKAPVKVGYWNAPDLRVIATEDNITCTAHVFDIHEDEAIMTLAFYNGGVHVVDLSGLVGVAVGVSPEGGELGGMGMREIAYYRFPNSDTWSAKTPKILPNGDFFLFGNDINRGLDVFRFEAEKPEVKGKGRGKWMKPDEARKQAENRPQSSDKRPYCLLPA
jgi:hypothetical protein